MKRICIYLSLLILLLPFIAQAQLGFENKIFRIIRKESYDKALLYGNNKIAKLGTGKKYYKRAIPYYLGIGLVHKKAGNYKDAEKSFYEAYNILNYKQEKKFLIKIIDFDVLDELGLMYLETGNFVEAKDLIETSIRLRKKRFEATNLLRYRPYLAFGNYFYKTGQADSAYFYFQKYLLYIKNSNHTSKQELNRYADTYQRLAELELGRDNLKKGLRFARQNKKWQFHKWTKKEAGKNNLNKIIALNLLSEAYRLKKDFKTSLTYSNKSFELYDKVIKTPTHHQVPLLINRGKLYWDVGMEEEAEACFIKAAQLEAGFIDRNFSTLTEYEKENFYASLKKNFDILNAFAAAKIERTGNTQDSLLTVVYDFHIKTKAIILNESNRMMEGVLHSNDKELIKKFSEWKKLKNELAKRMVVEEFKEENEDIRNLKQNINRLEKEMAVKTALFKDSAETITWKDVQNALKENEAAVEVIRVGNYGKRVISKEYLKKSKRFPETVNTITDSISYMILYVDKNLVNSPGCVIIKNGKQLEGRNYIYYRNCNQFKIADNNSYNVYWKPIAEKLENKSKVYVSSDGVYNLLNLWILKNPVNNKYLLDEINIINITNTRTIVHHSPVAFTNSTALLIGRPHYYLKDQKKDVSTDTTAKRKIKEELFRDSVSDLPGTEKEVTSIASFLDQKNIKSKVVLGEHATEDFIKSVESEKIIHIATHGYFDQRPGRNPMLRSGLLLTGVADDAIHKNEDGILTAYEASSMDLKKTDLVILSACETGLGEIKHGEGVYGLQRAFEVAGVKNIIMSMWKVNDMTTQELMISFYNHLLTTNNVTVAFRNTQMEIREKYPETYYWGAFKLIGY